MSSLRKCDVCGKTEATQEFGAFGNRGWFSITQHLDSPNICGARDRHWDVCSVECLRKIPDMAATREFFEDGNLPRVRLVPC
jgi:hypothetical protein